MKNFNTLFLATLGLGLLASQAARAQQSIGNGATPARTGTMLDVNGPLATAETAVAATGTTAPTATIATATGQARLTTGTATAGPITVSYGAAANAGQRLVIYNSTALAATFNSQDIPAGQAVEFVYSNSGWRASAGGGNGVAATNGLTKTGNAIGLGGTLTGATAINQNGNNFGLTNGNVGIGTTAPSQRLDLADGGLRVGGSGTISAQGAYLQWNRTGTVGETWLLSQKGQGQGGIYFGASDIVSSGSNAITQWGGFDGSGNFNVNNNNFVSGRVGIGTNSPFAKLEISGGAREDGSGTDVAMAFSSGPSTGLSPLRHYIRTRHTAGIGSGLGGNSIDFYLNNSGNNPTASSGPGVGNIHAVTFDNNNGAPRVGIGVTTPTQTLDVVGNVRIRGLSAGGIVTADANGNLGLASGAIDATTASNGLSKNGVDVQLGGPLTRPTAVDGISAANPLSFSGTTGATFTNTTAAASSNVTSRALALQGAYNGGAPSTGGTHLAFLEGANTEVSRIASVQENGGFNVGLGFHTAVGAGASGTLTERLRISAAGNVGIGTLAPNSRLSLTPTATEAKITLFDGGSLTAHYGFGVSSNQLNYDVLSGASHVFYVNSKNGSGSEVLRTNANGTYIQTVGGPQLAISTTRGTVGSAVPANADGNVYYEVVGLENHVFGGNVVPNSDNALSLGLSGARWSAVYAANGVIQTSDSRLKTHIENSGYGLQAVLKLRPVTYNWKSQPTTNHMVGFLAQELEQVVPEAVVAPEAAGEYYGVKYEELIPVLTKAIQEQQVQIEALKTANTKLQAQASGADAKVNTLEASLLSLAEQVKQLQGGGATATTK